MRSHSLLRPLVVIAASCSMMGSALADTFGNFIYTSNGTSVTITGHANVATPNLVIPAQINGLPVRRISFLYMGTPVNNLGNSVTSVTIPEGVTTIDSSVFKDFFVLTSVTIPNSVTAIGSHAFLNCLALTSATLGNGVTELDGTFWGCSSLTTVDLPDNLVSMTSTFASCSKLAQVEIPSSVTNINGAFQGCSSLTSVVIPNGVTTIGGSTFLTCSKLENVTLPSGLVTIGDIAFKGCTSLTSLNFPSSLKTIQSNAFEGCTGLTSFDLPAGLATIGSSAFDGCTGLTSVTIPESVTTIGDNAFWRCPNLTEVNLPSKFLSSLSNLGFDYKPEVASNVLVTGIANALANSPGFVSKLADTIIAKNGHYGLATQANVSGVAADITTLTNGLNTVGDNLTTVTNDLTTVRNDLTTVVNETPQAVRDVLAQINAEAPPANAINSDLGTLTVKKGKPVTYATATNFGATAFAAIGLPDGVVIDSASGVISGKPKKAGTFNVFLHAGIPGGGSVSAVKVISVTP